MGLAQIHREHLPPLLQRQVSVPAIGTLGETYAPQKEMARLVNNRIAPHIMRAVLSCLVTAKPGALGRNRLCRLLAAEGIAVTEGRMKGLIQALAAKDLVAVGTTKQGTTVTPKGEHMLANLTSAAAAELG